MKHDWEEWIDRLKSADLGEDELRRFEQALKDDPANADAYLDALLLETALESEHLPHPREKTSPPVAAPPRRRMLATAAAVGLAALLPAAYFAGRGKDGAVPPADRSLATITDADDGAAAAGIRIGALIEGGTLKVPDGAKVGIAMRAGARLEAQGPAEIDFLGADKIHMKKGRLSTYAPTYARGFTVDTEDGRVVDLGTRFVTAAGAGRGTEVHVQEGLVEAYVSPGDAPLDLRGEHAAVLKDGRFSPIEFLARRLEVPLDPVLPDCDGDGTPDTVEDFYRSDPRDPASRPAALRMEESFAGYPAGPVARMSARAAGLDGGSQWQGGGTFHDEGLAYERDGRKLKVSGGCLETTGETEIGAMLSPVPAGAPQGVVYLSFLMQQPPAELYTPNSFSGLLLYSNEVEELFTGDPNTYESYGSRFRGETDDSFSIPLEPKPQLFVIRIDRTRLVTEIFVNPVPGEPESVAKPSVRRHVVPAFDRLSVRSGRLNASFPVKFDEIRLGLTWDSVVPAAE